MRSASVLAVPSRVEAFGIVVLEGWRAGAPVIVTDRGGPPEFVTHLQDGYLVAADDVDELRAALEFVLGDPVAAAGMARRGPAPRARLHVGRHGRRLRGALSGAHVASRGPWSWIIGATTVVVRGQVLFVPESRRLRIAMVSYYLPSGSKTGVGYQAHAIANELADRGHHVDMFTPCDPVEGARYGHRQIPLTGSLRTFRFALELRKLDLGQYDVLHAHGDDYWLWRRRVPVHVRTMHGSCFEEALHIRGAKERLRMVALGFSEVLATLVADRTALVSPRTRRWMPWVRTVIPNGVDTAHFAASGTKSARPTVLFVGTWTGRKRGAQLAEAFVRDVLPVVPDAELRMVTRDAPATLPAGVVALGRLDDDELVEEYGRAWAFCLPSSYEGFGIPYAEAMAAGLPVVATPNIGARYVTDEGRAGVLASLDHVGTAVAAVLRDDRMRARLGAAGLERSRAFDLARVVDAYERMYRVGVKPDTGLEPSRRG